jgi:tRNA threonylcarbamoyladenosine biosynthesis protein TsaE
VTSSAGEGPVALVTRSEEETEDLARRLAEALPPGTTIALAGPLGSGKTAFARGVARGLGLDPAEVASPTFTYLVDYSGGRLPLVHADLYRLGDLDDLTVEAAIDSIGLAEALEGEGITVVEWWPCYRGAEPRRAVHVEFAIEPGDVRSIHLIFRGPDLDDARQAVLS